MQNETDKGAFGSTGYEGSVGICGLAGLAFMSEGSSPGIGKFGKSVDGCADFLCRMTSPEGYISREGAGGIGNMYAHGFATLFLAMVYGMTRRREVGELRSAVKLTLSAQNDEGGWRYQPIPRDADLSVTVCQIMALRAARDYAASTCPTRSASNASSM
ncbi:MAG: hypothetical protein R3F11_22795 [Verrucomicrobiales bacterium]